MKKFIFQKKKQIINNKDLLDKEPNNRLKATIINLSELIILLLILIFITIFVINVILHL